MFTIDSLGRRAASLVVWAIVSFTAIGFGLFISVAVRAQGESSAPAISDLRPAPDVRITPGRHFSSLEEIARYADFVGVVRVESVTPRSTGTLPSLTGLDVSYGRAAVAGEVLSSAGGYAQGQHIEFSEDVWYKPGTNALASPEILPVVQPGRAYLLFLRDGQVLYPGGIYGLEGGKVWFIGQWQSSGSRSYPPGLSGMSVEAAIALVKEIR